MKIQKLSKLASRLLFSLTLLTLFLSGLALAEEYKAWVYTKLPDTPEGVCIDSQGTLYATLFHTNRVVKLERDGTWMHVAWVPSERESGKGDLMGIEADKYDNLYVAYKQSSKFDNLFDPQHAACHDVSVTKSGVYKIDGKTREVTAIATRADGWPCCMPDDVDIDDAGNIYVSDLTYSCIWKITPDRKVTLWSAHRLLNWSNPPLFGCSPGGQCPGFG